VIAEWIWRIVVLVVLLSIERELRRCPGKELGKELGKGLTIKAPVDTPRSSTANAENKLQGVEDE
jgi:hypothetical protein